MSKSGRCQTPFAILMYGSVFTATVDATGWRGRTTGRCSLKVATSRAGGVGVRMVGTGVVEGADGADWVRGGASRGEVAKRLAVRIMRVPDERVGA